MIVVILCALFAHKRFLKAKEYIQITSNDVCV